jgi:hypothetical protein
MPQTATYIPLYHHCARRKPQSRMLFWLPSVMTINHLLHNHSVDISTRRSFILLPASADRDAREFHGYQMPFRRFLRCLLQKKWSLVAFKLQHLNVKA